jgi:hypothetical protein
VHLPRLTYLRRVAEMEEKLDGLVALLVNARGKVVDDVLSEGLLGETAATSSMHSSSIGSPINSPPNQESNLVSHVPTHINPTTQPQPATPFQYPIATFPDFLFDVIQDPISKNIISFDKAEEYLTIFRLREPSFPWVRLPKQTSLDTLRRERPFLLLSVLTFAAYEDLQLQRQLETELKDSLMKKILTHGEKSLDLLQGLLVYLAW